MNHKPKEAIFDSPEKQKTKEALDKLLAEDKKKSEPKKPKKKKKTEKEEDLEEEMDEAYREYLKKQKLQEMKDNIKITAKAGDKSVDGKIEL